MKYLLDTNVFISAYNLYYKKDVVPSFWGFLNGDDDIFTIKEVKDEVKPAKKDKDKDEIDPVEDELYELIKHVKTKESPDFSTISEISAYVEKSYEPQAVQEFFKGADLPLICVAKEHKMILVTHEKLLSGSFKKVKIPNICEKFNVQYMNIYELLENKKVCLGKSYTYRK